MSYKIILLPTARKEEAAFIGALAALYNIELTEAKHKHYVVLWLDGGERNIEHIVSHIVAESITTFYKFRALKSAISVDENSGYEYYAYLGALLSVELEEEHKRIHSAVDGVTEIAVEGLTELRLKELIEGWEGLGELAEMLLSQCEGEEDVYSLIPYFLGGEGGASHITVSGGARGVGLWNSGDAMVIPKLSGNPEQDLILALMRARPTHIVIKNKEEISDRLLDALRALGE